MGGVSHPEAVTIRVREYPRDPTPGGCGGGGAPLTMKK